jgi:hypothetical protein
VSCDVNVKNLFLFSIFISMFQLDLLRVRSKEFTNALIYFLLHTFRCIDSNKIKDR